jgi:hypothetical protein
MVEAADGGDQLKVITITIQVSDKRLHHHLHETMGDHFPTANIVIIKQQWPTL